MPGELLTLLRLTIPPAAAPKARALSARSLPALPFRWECSTLLQQFPETSHLPALLPQYLPPIPRPWGPPGWLTPRNFSQRCSRKSGVGGVGPGLPLCPHQITHP